MRIIQMLLLVLTMYSGFSQAQVPVDSESKIRFKIRNFGFNVNGSFKGLAGKIVFDPASPGISLFDVTIDAATVDTDNNTRNGHLRKEEYFDVKNYPKIRFVSTRISKSNKEGTLIVFGKLTIKKTTRDISIPFIAKPANNGYLFTGNFKINRLDFDIGKGSTISDNLTVSLEVATKRS